MTEIGRPMAINWAEGQETRHAHVMEIEVAHKADGHQALVAAGERSYARRQRNPASLVIPEMLNEAPSIA